MIASSTLREDSGVKMKPNPDQQRLITEIGDWCGHIQQKVMDCGTQLSEEVMTSTNPALLKFVKSDNCSLLDKTVIGFLTVQGPGLTEVYREKGELSTIREEEENEESTHLAVGFVGIAKWREDGVWYNAKIERIMEDGTFWVLFQDYGNSDIVSSGEIVSKVEDVPGGDSLDECVNNNSGGQEVGPPLDRGKVNFEVGQVVIAKWSEDKIWYNAKILALKEGTVKVIFLDYGNEEEVEEKNIVLCGADIPAEEEDDVDQYVVMTVMATSEKTCDTANKNDVSRPETANMEEKNGETATKKEVPRTLAAQPASKDTSPTRNSGDDSGLNRTKIAEQVEIPAKAVQGKTDLVLDVNTECYCKWSEDNVWYNAVVEAAVGEQYEIIFVDYGNGEVAERSNITLSWHDIPEDDDVDEYVKPYPKKEQDVANTNGISIKPQEAELNKEVTKVADSKVTEVSKLPETSKEEKGEAALVEGKSCLAKWDEDEVWYRAKVTKSTVDGLEVLFIDYGNSAFLSPERIVLDFKDIPAEDVTNNMVDENVSDTAQVSSFMIPGELPMDTNVKGDVTEAAEISQDSKVKDDMTKVPDSKVKDPEVSEDSKEKKGEEKDGVFLVEGQFCLAKWDEDDVWYRAKVTKSKMKDVEVLFVDYGNSTFLSSKRIVLDFKDIPAEDITNNMVDENVENVSAQALSTEVVTAPASQPLTETESVASPSMESVSWSVGDGCIARWSEDNIWYNAKIISVSQSSCFVQFVDYGNEDTINLQDIVTDMSKIPPGQEEFIGENVGREPGLIENVSDPMQVHNPTTQEVSGPVEALSVSSPDSAAMDSPVEPVAVPSPASAAMDSPVEPVGWSVGAQCIARWSEDNIWYNAKIISVTATSCFVLFVDYGNEDSVKLQDIVTDMSKIPAGQEEFIDENVEVVPSAPIQAPATESVSAPSQAPATKESVSWSVGEVCIARWSEDNVWYNAKIISASQSSCLVLFVDYGNEDRINLQDIVTDKSNIPPGQEEFIDENVVEVSESVVVKKSGDSVIKKAGEDVNEKIYDNQLRSLVDPLEATGGKVDPVTLKNIKTCLNSPIGERVQHEDVKRKEESEASLSYLSSDLEGESVNLTNLTSGSSGIGDSLNSTFLAFIENLTLSLRKKNVLKVLTPAGVTVLADGNVAVVSRNENCVKFFSSSGVVLPSPLKGHREFEKPTNILRLSNGKIVVRDVKGLQLFSQQGDFIKPIGSDHQNSYYGLAEDNAGNIITINVNDSTKPCGPGTLTAKGQTDVLFFDQDGDYLLKQMQMVEIVAAAEEDLKEEKRGKSKCRQLGFSKGRLFVVDSGNNKVFIIPNDNEAGQLEDEEFSGPSEIAFDNQGNVIIVDTKNNRLQLLDANQNAYPVKVDCPLNKPHGIYYDKENSELYVSNVGENAVVCYHLS